MSNKIHTLSGQSFHGAYCVGVRGPAEGFFLSARQERKITLAMCPSVNHGCMCGGGYGEADSDSASLDYSIWEGAPFLRPAGYAEAEYRKERAAWLAQMDREEAEGLAIMAAQYGEQA